jgi:hypothetical protein
MQSRNLLVLALIGLMCPWAVATDWVSVEGSTNHYPTSVMVKVGNQEVALSLTGAALRKKYFFSIYTIASYVVPGAAIDSPESLITVNCPKQLQLVMERDLSGAELAEAFTAAIRMNHGVPTFDQELASLTEYLKPLKVVKGDHIYLTHVPGVGLHCEVVGKAETTIANVAFAQAVWEIYLGKINLGDDIKKGLLSRR